MASTWKEAVMANETAVVVGAGSISKAWFGPLKEEGVRVAAVVDLDVERAHQKIEQFALDAEPSDDLSASLARHRPDFVVDLTIPEAHCPVTCAALEAGCHVIGEKPMASSMEEARRMVAAAEKSGRLYMVSQSRRWNPTHDRLRRAVQSGQIGRVTTVNCDFYIGAHFSGFRAEMESPLILDMSIHHFDLARFLTGLDPLDVYAYEFNPAGSWYAGDVAASCIFQMSEDAVLTYRGSWCAEGCRTSWNGDWRIIGTEGTLIYAGDAEPYGERVVPPFQGLVNDGEPVNVPDSPLEHKAQRGAIRELLRFFREGVQPQCECHDNIKSLAMVFGAKESSRAGKRTQICV
jgi:predicted dehydrogenase